MYCYSLIVFNHLKRQKPFLACRSNKNRQQAGFAPLAIVLLTPDIDIRVTEFPTHVCLASTIMCQKPRPRTLRHDPYLPARFMRARTLSGLFALVFPVSQTVSGT